MHIKTFQCCYLVYSYTGAMTETDPAKHSFPDMRFFSYSYSYILIFLFEIFLRRDALYAAMVEHFSKKYKSYFILYYSLLQHQFIRTRCLLHLFSTHVIS